MSLLSILSFGGQGLGAHRAATAVAGNNLANVNTEGYARQRVSLTSQGAVVVRGARIGTGVGTGAVQSARDRFLMGQVHHALAESNRAETEAGLLESIHSFDIDAPGALNSAITDVFGALRDVVNTPGDASARQAAVASAQRLAQSFQRSAGELNSARSVIDQQLRSQAGEVNQLASDVARLNAEIAIAVASGQTPHELIGARAMAADQLAGLTGAKITPSDDTSLTMTMPGGQSLVNGDRSSTLSVVADPTNQGHLALEVTPQGGSAGQPVFAIGGEMGGALAARDGGLRDALDALDALAFEFAEEMNAVHGNGFGLDGTTGQAMFDAGAQEGAAGRIVVDAQLLDDPRLLAASATAGGTPGDNENMLLLLGVESTDLPSGERPIDALNDLVTGLGAAASRARAEATQEGALRAHLEDLRAGTEGVSVDEEMIELQKSQRAFEAVSKVITTTDQMLNTLMELR